MKINLPKNTVQEIAAPVAAVVASFVTGGLLILAVGGNPFFIYWRLFDGIFGNPYGIAQVLFKATPLFFTGLSVAFAFRCGLFNIGAEGQFYAGAFLMAYAGFTFPGLPGIILLPLCIAAGMLGGAVWAGIPGFLKSKTGAHEVITTIMMNFIAIALTNYLVANYFHLPETVHTAEIAAGAWIPRLDTLIPAFKGSPVNFSLVLALVFAAGVWYVLFKTRFGFEIRSIGLNPNAARYAGVPVENRIFQVMLISGMMSGLVGANFVMGYKHYFEQGFSAGSGFMGIAVALLGRNHPAGILLAALLFGFLSYGGLIINAYVPKELVDILQAAVIIFVIVFTRTRTPDD
jgi:simple sugar transport system permease protein